MLQETPGFEKMPTGCSPFPQGSFPRAFIACWNWALVQGESGSVWARGAAELGWLCALMGLWDRAVPTCAAHHSVPVSFRALPGGSDNMLWFCSGQKAAGYLYCYKISTVGNKWGDLICCAVDTQVSVWVYWAEIKHAHLLSYTLTDWFYFKVHFYIADNPVMKSAVN